jgi:hypothetical protein
MANCPHCGKPIAVTLTKSGASVPAGYILNGRQVFHAAATGPAAPAALYEGYDYEKRQPAREPSLQGDVLVPAAQSLLTGLALAAPAAALMGLLGYEANTAIFTGGGVGLLGATGMWLLKMDAHSQLLWMVEKITGRDIDGDDAVGAPERRVEPEPVRIESVQEKSPGKFIGVNIDLPAGVDRGLFFVWAAGVVSGETAARDNWIGQGKPFGRKQYDDLMAAMERIGIIADYGDGKGRVLTTGGRHRLVNMLQKTA